MTALIPWGASATPVRSEPLPFIPPGLKPTNRCKWEEDLFWEVLAFGIVSVDGRFQDIGIGRELLAEEV
jgi:hypothetical protein